MGGPSLGVDVAASVVAQVVGLATVALGLTNWTHWRIRVLLYAGQPDWP